MAGCAGSDGFVETRQDPQLSRFPICRKAGVDKLEDLISFCRRFMDIAAVLIIIAGSGLLYNLGAGRVPSVLKPLANVWVHVGYDPKWINIGLWILFVFLAVTMLLILGVPLYSAVVHLGRGF